MVLETEFVCDGGAVRLVDFMPAEGRCDVVRIIEGLDGEVPIEMLLDVCFGYGAYGPLIEKKAEGTCFMAGAGGLVPRAPRPPPFAGQRVSAHLSGQQGGPHPV